MSGTYTSPFFGFQFEYDAGEVKVEEVKIDQMMAQPGQEKPLMALRFVPTRASPQHYLGGLGDLVVQQKPRFQSLEQLEQGTLATLGPEVDQNTLKKKTSNLGDSNASTISCTIPASVYGEIEYHIVFCVRGDHIFQFQIQIIRQQDKEYVKLLRQLAEHITTSWKWLKPEPLRIRAAEFKHFVSAEHGFRVRYPLDWIVKEASKRPRPAISGSKPSPESSLRVVDFEWREENTKFELIVAVETIPDSLTLDQYIELAKLAMEQGMIYIGNVTTKNIEISGVPSVSLYYEDLSNNKYLRVYIKKENKIFVLSFYSNAKDVGEMPMFVRMANTFEFITQEQADKDPVIIFEDLECNHSIQFPTSFTKVEGGEKGGIFIHNPLNSVTKPFFDKDRQCTLHLSFTPLIGVELDFNQMVQMFEENYFTLGESINNISTSVIKIGSYEWSERVQTGKFINVEGVKMIINKNTTKRFARLGCRKIDGVFLLYLIVIESPVEHYDAVFNDFKDVLDSFTFIEPASLWSPN